MTPPESAHPDDVAHEMGTRAECEEAIAEATRAERARIVDVLVAEAACIRGRDGAVVCRWCKMNMAVWKHSKDCPVTIAEKVNHGE